MKPKRKKCNCVGLEGGHFANCAIYKLPNCKDCFFTEEGSIQFCKKHEVIVSKKDEDSAGIGSSDYLTDGKREDRATKSVVGVSCPSNPAPSKSNSADQPTTTSKGKAEESPMTPIKSDEQEFEEWWNDCGFHETHLTKSMAKQAWLAARSKQIEAMISRTSNPAVLVFLRKEMERVK